ncbi:MAG TPA: hypothetical protein VFC44_04730 [Candidatus Saccharimonadales bacterium]|nr:hypothetical protein [Candidatus Saccharimonadales bacterium]
MAKALRRVGYETGVQNDFCRRVLDRLHEDFTLKELHQVLLASGLTDTSDATATRVARGILLLAESNFEVNFLPDNQVSQRVLFPSVQVQGVRYKGFDRATRGSTVLL